MVASCFGVMFAQDHAAAASEAVRVCRQAAVEFHASTCSPLAVSVARS